MVNELTHEDSTMSGFFLVTDIPQRRVVQYKRISHSGDGVRFVDDESALGQSVDEMPYADKTGIAIAGGGTIYEVPYLADAGDVYFSKQPANSSVGDTLTAIAKSGTAPYVWQWYKDDKQVVNVPTTEGKLVAADAGDYFCVVTDANGIQAYSQVAHVTEDE